MCLVKASSRGKGLLVGTEDYGCCGWYLRAASSRTVARRLHLDNFLIIPLHLLRVDDDEDNGGSKMI